DESEKGKAVEEPEEHHVSRVRSKRGKGYMCSGNQEQFNLQNLDVEDTHASERGLKLKGVALEDPDDQTLLDLRKGSKETRLDSIRQERQAVRVEGEGSSVAHDKYYEFENISPTESDATRDSSCSDTNEEKDDETDDFDDSNMDLSDDDPNKGDDDASRFWVFMYNKSKKTTQVYILQSHSYLFVFGVHLEPSK
nr:hypothetical protein [Tanacetum cinerariifolium]